MVKFRRHDDFGQWAQSQTNVGVQEQPEEDLSEGYQPRCFRWKTCSNEEKEGRGDERAVKGMCTEPACPIHVFGRVMNGMKAPQLRDLVIPSMCPIACQIKQRHPHKQQVWAWNGLDVRSEQQTR